MSSREKLFQNNHKHGSQPKYFNSKKYTSNNTGPPQATIARPSSNVNSLQFQDPCDHINPMYNIHEDTDIIDTQEQDIEDSEVEQEELFEDANYNLITEEELENIYP